MYREILRFAEENSIYGEVSQSGFNQIDLLVLPRQSTLDDPIRFQQGISTKLGSHFTGAFGPNAEHCFHILACRQKKLSSSEFSSSSNNRRTTRDLALPVDKRVT